MLVLVLSNECEWSQAIRRVENDVFAPPEIDSFLSFASFRNPKLLTSETVKPEDSTRYGLQSFGA